jgi:D-ala D-ala ligase N-terminus.
MNWSTQQVALLYGGVGSEADVSREGAQTLIRAMCSLGIEPLTIDVNTDWIGQLQALKPTHD